METNKKQFLIAYKPRIKQRGIVAALKFLAAKEGMKFNTYLEKVFMEHTSRNGISWSDEGDLIINNDGNIKVIKADKSAE